MAGIIESITEFFTHNSRGILYFLVFFGILYGWVKLSETETYYRWFIKFFPSISNPYYSLGQLIRNKDGRKLEAEQLFQQSIALRPDYPWGYYALYYIQADIREFDKAKDTLDEMIKRFPQDGVTFACLANYHWRQGLYEKANHSFQEALRLTPNYGYIHAEYGRYLLNRGELNAAEREFRSQIKLDPTDDEVYCLLAQVLEKMQRFGDAEIEYKKAIKVAPNSEAGYSGLWELFDNQKEYIKAENFFKEVILKKPQKASLYKYLSLALEKQGQVESANLYIEQLAMFSQEQPNSSELINISLALSLAKRSVDAERVIRTFLEKEPDNANAQRVLGVILSNIEGKEDKAINALQKAIELSPFEAFYSFCLATTLVQFNRHEDAEPYYRNALKLQPSNLDLYTFFGASLQNYNPEEAEIIYRKGLQVNPVHIDLLNDLAYLLITKKQYEEAEQLARKALEMNPQSAERYILLADIFSKQKRLQEAEPLYRKAVELDPLNRFNKLNLVNHLQQTSQFIEALSILVQLSKQDPNDFITHVSIASVHKSLGNTEQVKEATEKSRQSIPKNGTYYYNLACIESIADNITLAFEYLAKSVAEDKDFNPAWAREDPDLAWIRDDPRFAQIVGAKEENHPVSP